MGEQLAAATEETHRLRADKQIQQQMLLEQQLLAERQQAEANARVRVLRRMCSIRAQSY